MAPIPRGTLAAQGRGLRLEEEALCILRVVWERAPENLLEGPRSPQNQTNPGCTSTGAPKAELRRGGSSRSPRSKARGEGPGPATPLQLDLTKVGPAH